MESNRLSMAMSDGSMLSFSRSMSILPRFRPYFPAWTIITSLSSRSLILYGLSSISGPTTSCEWPPIIRSILRELRASAMSVRSAPAVLYPMWVMATTMSQCSMLRSHHAAALAACMPSRYFTPSALPGAIMPSGSRFMAKKPMRLPSNSFMVAGLNMPSRAEWLRL